jgi:hypothetical protein
VVDWCYTQSDYSFLSIPQTLVLPVENDATEPHKKTDQQLRPVPISNASHRYVLAQVTPSC